jgi:hypothetical protein
MSIAANQNHKMRRRAQVLDGLKQFADAVLEVAPDLPAVRLEFMRAMLRRDDTKPK